MFNKELSCTFFSNTKSKFLALLLISSVVWAPTVFAQAASIVTKEAQVVGTSTPLTELELGQAFEYQFQWNCSIVSTPPNDCGTFNLVDPLPSGFIFDSCLVSSPLYNCVHDVGTNTVTIDLTAPNVLEDGDSASAIILGKLSTDPALFPVLPAPYPNTATATVGEVGVLPTTSAPTLNAPTNNWSITKTVAIPGLPINPALDNNVVYKIEICPNGPAGLGTGTIRLEDPVITDACPAGATLVGASYSNDSMMGSTPLTTIGACPALGLNLSGIGVTEFDPADGCQVVRLTTQYPSGTFAVTDMVTNTVDLSGSNISAGTCPNGCTASVISELDVPMPNANITKSAKRDSVGLGARNVYTIAFDTSNTNIAQTNVVIEDIYPTEIEVLNVSHSGWSNDSILANVIELPSNTVLIAAYDGTGFNFSPPAVATGFRIEFIAPVLPGFDGGSIDITHLANGPGLIVSSTYQNCATVSTSEVTADPMVVTPEACHTTTIIDDTSDTSLGKSMPTAVKPGDPFTTTLTYLHDDTSTVGADNPTVVDCLSPELEFLSWDTLTFSGLDDPRVADNLTNTSPKGVEPNLEVLVFGDAGFTCTDPNNTMLRWSWQDTAPAGALQIGQLLGDTPVDNPFIFPVRPDRPVQDNIGDSSGDFGLLASVRFDVTLRVRPGILEQTGLQNFLESTQENPGDLRCLNGTIIDTNDIDGDANTTEQVCRTQDTFNVLAAAALGGIKFVGGFPGLPNFDPANPPADNTAAASNSIATPAYCPQDIDGRTRAPCVAQIIKDQPFDYQILLSNDGNVPLTNYVIYDVLPNTDTAGSDTGTSEALAGASRGSTWTPQLMGPISLSSTNAVVTTELAEAVIEYSASSNSCRPDLSNANDIGGSGWQTGCIDDWTETPLADATTFPEGYASVRSWRVMIPFVANSWPVGNPFSPLDEDIKVNFPMLAQSDAPASDYLTSVQEIAWNNIAHRATNATDSSRLLAAEVIKTGIIVAPEFPLSSTGLRIGNLVWLDANNNGIAEDGEQGLFDVTVELWTDVTGDGPSADDTLYDATQTDAQGHYLFDDADVLNRNNLGLLAGDYYVVIPSAQTGSFVLSDNYSSLVDAPVANDNTDNDDNGAFVVSDLVTPVPADLDGIYSGTVNLAIDAEPVNEQLRGDDITDDDADFFDDNDSNVSVDFGFYQLRLGNHIWLDEDSNGTADSSEPAIENMNVQLFLDDGNGIFDPGVDALLGFDTTDEFGQYIFDGLDIGNYFLAIPTGQTGLEADGDTYSTEQIQSSPGAGTGLGADNDDDGTPGTFGGITYASVSDLLMLTVNGASSSENDSSSNGINGGSATDTMTPNAELFANIEANLAFPDSNSFLTADFGFVPTVSLGSTIWIDRNGNSTQDVGEFPIPNATVTLLDNAAIPMPIDGDLVLPGIQLVQVSTDADGQYNFNDLLPGTYRVSVDLSTSAMAVPNIEDYLPAPIQVATPNNNNQLDSNIDFSADTNIADLTHISGPITLLAGTEPSNERDPISSMGTGAAIDPDQPNQTLLPDNAGNMTLDMGFVPPVSLGSTLWVDDNEDGLQTAGETPIEDATVTLLNPNGTVFDSDPYTAGIQSLTAVTDSEGQYNFDGLPAGDYRVQVDLSTANNVNAAVLVPTPRQVADPDAAGPGLNANDDSNIDTGFDPIATDQIHTSGIITLLPDSEPTGETGVIGTPGPDQPNQGLTAAEDPDASGNMTVDFGFIEPVSLGSTAWFDTNGDGQQTASEPPIVAALVTLLNADGSVYDRNPATAAIDAFTVSTDGDGQYNFNGLPEGDYRVQINLTPATSHAGAMLSPTPAQTPDPDAAGPGQDNNTDSNVDVLAPGHNPAANTYQSGVVTLSIDGEPLAAVETDLIGTPGPDQPNQTATQPDDNGNMTVDMGFFAPVSLGSTIWNDTNADGDQDAAEPAIVGATITLLNAAGIPVDGNPNMAGVQLVTDVTDIDGQYNFDGLLPGDYRVRVDLGSVTGGDDYIPTPVQVADPDAAGPGLNNNTDSNVDTAFDTDVNDLIHTSGVITLSAGGEPIGETDPIGAGGADQPNQGLTPQVDPDASGNMTVDMGFIKPVSIGSTAWKDTDADGVQDAGEPPIVDAVVTLLNADGTVYDSDPNIGGIQALTDPTDAQGQYNFNDIPEGDYRVQIDLALASNTNAILFVPTPAQVADPDAVGPGQDNNVDSNVDFLFDPITTDQIHTSGIVTLSAGGEPTGEVDQIGTPGADQPNQTLTAANQPDASGNMTVDFGFIEPVSLGSTVWFDSDTDGVQDDSEPPIIGAVVTLLNSNSTVYDRDPTAPGIQALTATTDGTGQYNFNGLPAGSYIVQVDLSAVTGAGSISPTPTQVLDPENNDNTDSNIATVDQNGSPAITSDDLYRSGVIILSQGTEPVGETDLIDGVDGNGAVADQPNQTGQIDNSGNMTVDLGFFQPVSLGSTIWNDTNADGTQDSGEPAIEGATVTLLNAAGVVVTGVAPVMTNVDGEYSFDGLLPGDYRVRVDLSTVTGGEDFIPSLAQVADPDTVGAASLNSNSDSNVDVPFDSTGSNSTTDQIHTSGVVTLAPGTEPTGETDLIGTAGPDQPGQDTAGVDPDNSGNMTVDMGFFKPVSLGSTVWLDTNGDGDQDSGEAPIVGATVTLLTSAGAVYDNEPLTSGIQPLTATTDINGQYNFNGLPAGDYRVQVDLAGASNTNATFFVPTLPQVADPDAVADDNTDSNIDTAFDPNLTDQIHTSGVVTLSLGGEPISETDLIGAGPADQPNQGLTAANQPDANGNMTVDFGFMEPVSLGSTVWFDSNTDGVQDDNEPPILGAVATLLNSDLTVFDSNPNAAGIQALTSTTGATGQYNFNGLPAGSYIVQVSLAGVTGANSISPSPVQVLNPENNVNSDSNIATIDANGSPAVTSDDLYRSGIVVLAPRTEPASEVDSIDGVDDNGPVSDQPNQTGLFDTSGNMTVDFGFFQPVSLGSTIWEDLNGDGAQDLAEPAIVGATVTLLDAAGAVVTGVTPVMTNADGEYNFDGLLPGDYRVRVDLSTVTGGADLFPSPVQIADPDLLGDPSENSNDDSNIDLVFDTTGVNSTTDQIHTSGVITLTPGAEPTGETDSIGTAGPDQPNQDTAGVDPDAAGNMTLDMGFVRPVSLGSTIWQDENGDGTQDDGEPTIVNATVTVLDAAGDPVDGDPYTPGVQAITTVTDTEGQYFFNDLPPGDYRVQVDLATVVGGGALIPTPTQVPDPDAVADDNTDSNIDVPFDTNLADQIHTSGVITLTAGGEPISEVDPIDLIDGNGDVSDQPGQTVANPDNSGNMTVDMGFYAPVSIGSLVWEDSNGDGLQDAGEPPLAGSLVTLLAETAPGSGVFGPAFPIGSVVAVPTVTVGPDGLYEFTNLPPGNYKVRVTPAVGFFPSPVQNIANDDDTANDSNIAGESLIEDVIGRTAFESGVFEVTSGGEPNEAGPDTNRGDGQDGAPNSAEDLSGNMTIDFGFVPPASIGNYVWLDLDMDGVQDANENGIAGVEVTLTPPPGVDAGAGVDTPITVTTGPSGGYLFPNLPPYVNADPSIGYVVTVDPATLPIGLVQTYDEGATGVIGPLDNSSNGIQLDPNEEHLTADFGYTAPNGSLGDTIWIDADDDGVQDPGEPGIGGVTVSVTPPPDIDLGNGLGVPITTMTDGNGKYLFTGLPLNESYLVEVDITTLPTGYVSSTSGLGDPDVRDGNSTDADDSTFVVLTPENPVNLDADFGYLPSGDQNNSVGDTIWIDADADGEGPAGTPVGGDTAEQPATGVTVNLIDNGTGDVIASTTTDANGMYLFTGIPDGEYTVQVTDTNNVLDGLEQTFDNDGLLTPNESIVDLDSVSASATPIDDRDQDFGYVDSSTGTGLGTIGDTIFFDENDSGLPDDGEGLEGVTVSLFGPGPDGDITTTADNVLLATQVTDENGNYLFTGLDVSDTGANPGTDYQVVVDTISLPNGGDGWSNTVDPDTTGTGDSVSVTTLTTAIPEDLDQDFGYLGEDNNTLSGTVWPDTNGDGEQAEAGSFGGVTIEIRDQDGNVIRTVTTDSNGDYEVTNLPDGIYTVVVTDEDNVLNGFEHTDSPNGTSDTSDETSKDDTGYTVDLDSAGVVPTPVTDVTGDFGYQPVITNPISLGSFLASASGDGAVLFEWSTQTEVANLGFNVYAQVDGDWVVLNESLILGQGDAVSIQSYSATYTTDATVFALSDIDLTGRETIHGPYALGEEQGSIADRKAIDWDAEKAEREAKKAKRLEQRQQQQLKRGLQLKQLLKGKQLQNKGKDLSESKGQQEGSMSRFFEGVAVSLLSVLVPDAQAQTVNVTELINLQTTKHGIHEVSYADLLAAGLDLAGQQKDELALASQGQAVAIQVLGDDVFGAGSAIRFIATQVDTLYTDKNMYTLSLVSGGDSNRIIVDTSAIPQGAATATSYLATKAYEPQLKYSFTSPNQEDPFYAKRMVAVGKPASETVSLVLDDVAAGGNTGGEAPSLSVDVWGSTDLDGAANDHSFKVAFNGKNVAAKTFDGLRAQRVTTELALVREGGNTVQVSLPLDTGYAFDAVNLNSIEVKYPRQFVAIDDRLDFKSSFAKFRLSGFSENSMPSDDDLVAMRVDANGDTREIENAKASCRGDTCKVQLGGTGRVAHYYVSAKAALHTPALVALPMAADITSGQAKYLIISHPDFIGADGNNQLEALAAEMTGEMGSADVVDVDSIYAKFGYHLFDPTAIREYIKFAHATRGTRYVLLVGGDVYDYRQFENEDATSFIPSLYAATGNNITFAPVDAKYADIDDDNVPDFAIARLPVRTTNQLTNLLGKRTAYMNRSYGGKALLVADNYDAAQQYDFGDDADEIGSDYLGGFQIEKAYVDDLGTSAARAKVKQEIEAGTTLTAFFGHSSTNQWSFNGLFTGPDAAMLNNAGKPTVVTQWGCWNTYFVSPNEDSMGHRFMMEGDRGAVAVMGASTLTNADSERQLAKLVFARLANGERLGDAVTNAKQEYAILNPNDLDVLLGWTVLGLPELIVD